MPQPRDGAINHVRSCSHYDNSRGMGGQASQFTKSSPGNDDSVKHSEGPGSGEPYARAGALSLRRLAEPGVPQLSIGRAGFSFPTPTRGGWPLAARVFGLMGNWGDCTVPAVPRMMAILIDVPVYW